MLIWLLDLQFRGVVRAQLQLPGPQELSGSFRTLCTVRAPRLPSAYGIPMIYCQSAVCGFLRMELHPEPSVNTQDIQVLANAV